MIKPLIIALLWAFTILPKHGLAQIAKRIDSVARIHQSQGFNGNVLYSRNDSIIFTSNYGVTDFDTKRPLNDHTTFELASISKQFTAVAIIQLEEQGLLKYDQQVSEILPGFPYKDIKVEHLLRHQSGLADEQKLFYNKKFWNRKKKASSADLLQILIKHKPALAFDPGAQYAYSNTGYIVLAVIIEKLSGHTYAHYLRDQLFQPAGMTTASVVTKEHDPELMANAAKGYTYNTRTKGHQKAAKDKNHKHLNWMRTLNGGASIFASIMDLEKWKEALRYNKLISAKSKAKMFSTDQVSVKYGFGVAVYKETSKGMWVYHTGSWGGAKTMILYLPDSNELIVILSNNRYTNTYKTFDEALYGLLL